MKRQFVTDINMIKYEVCVEVAKLAFAGELESRRDEIPYAIIPGNTPKWRCCVYREREIVRQRVNLAEGRPAVGTKSNKSIVQVLPAACEGLSLIHI